MESRHAILVADSFSEEGLQILADGGANRVEYAPAISAEDLVRRAPECDAIVVRSRSRIDAAVIGAGTRLCVVGRAGVGLDNVDVAAATAAGVLVMNAPGGNTISTAEHTLGMMLALARRIAAADASMKSGAWEKKRFDGVELRGRTLGIVGLGRIGREVARRARAFGMHVVAFDPFVSAQVIAEHDVTPRSLAELVRTSDVLTMHVPLTEKTRGLVGAAMLATAKPSLLVVNCARGGLVDEAALADALRERRIAGAALDVFEEEPLPADHPFRRLDNVVLTPHLAASTGEAVREVAIELSRQIVDVLRGGPARNAANAPNLAPAMLEQMRPYLALAERLGRFLTQLVEGRVRALHLVASGTAAECEPLSALTTAMLVGWLQPISEQRVNVVNARHLIDEHGIEVVESRHHGHATYRNLLEVRAELEGGGDVRVQTTVFAPDVARIVDVNGKRVDTIPEGNLLVVENDDVPGIVGAVTTILGRHHINISQMTWGRTAPGEEAMTVINCDQEIPAALLGELRAIPHLLSARVIRL